MDLEYDHAEYVLHTVSAKKTANVLIIGMLISS